MRCSYLKKHHKSIYLSMLYSDTLCDHLEEIDQSANEMMELLVSQMAQAEGITEKLKAENQMRWVGLMNNILNAAEEIVKNDLIYV